MTRRQFVGGSASALAALAAGCTPGETAVDQRPHIVLLMGDDHGWEETGYNGHPFVKTPVLDEMAASGLRLDSFHAASPVCSPTRGSVMTGRHPNRYGDFQPGCSIRPEEITIAQLLRDAGYATGHFGKWHLGPVNAASPMNVSAIIPPLSDARSLPLYSRSITSSESKSVISSLFMALIEYV